MRGRAVMEDSFVPSDIDGSKDVAKMEDIEDVHTEVPILLREGRALRG